MGDIAQRGNKLTLKKILTSDAGRDIIRNVYDAVAPKHSPGQKGKPHSSKEGRTASIGRTLRDTMKILTGAQRDRGYAKGGRTLGRAGRRKDFKTHGKDVPTMAAEGGRMGLKKGGKVFTVTETKKGKPHWTQEGQDASIKRKFQRASDAHQKELKAKRYKKTGVRMGLKKGGKPWGTGPKPGSHEFMMQDIHKRKGKAIGGPAARALGKALKPQGVFKKDKSWSESRQKPPQLRKSKKERREEYRKKIQKGGGNVVFADEWKHIDPGLQKGLFKKEGGRIGLKKGGSDKKWIQKAVNPKHKGYCTPMTKKTCTPARKALARTFKKKAKTGWG